MDFWDEFFTDAILHNPDGVNIMICGVCVLPHFQKQGLARELVCEYCRREWERGRKRLILTCKQEKVYPVCLVERATHADSLQK